MAQGDTEAYGEFLDAYGGRIHALSRRYSQTPADAEDLTQEVSIQIFRSIKGYRGDSALATWVYRVTLNLCIRHARRKRLPTADFNEASLALADERRTSDPSGEAARSELSGKVHAALLRLSPLHREVVVLHELEGMTYQECAARLNVPVGTVKSRLSNAFTRLREALGGYVIGEELRADTVGETAG
jgi:RNA polymerase sigma-70 factor (ECF subfamily)